MTDTLRAKQNQEILDVYKNLNRQIVALQNKQVAVFPETLKPKTERDVGVEVNVDKSIENLNRAMELKLGALEFFVQNISIHHRAKGLSAPVETTAPFINAQQSLTNTGDIIPLWNAVVRFYQTPLLSRDSQEAVKVKLQELEPNLEAMIYGLNSAIDYIFSFRDFTDKVGLALLDLLRTLAVYKGIKRQVDSAELQLITADILQADFKNVFQDLSAERLTLLKEVAPRGLISSTAIRNIPDFKTANYEDRIKAIEADLGVVLPREDVDALSKLSERQFTRAIEKYQEARSGQEEMITREEFQVLQQAQKREDDWVKAVERVNDLDFTIDDLRMELREQMRGATVSRGEIENSLEEEPELPIEPVRPTLNAHNARRLRDGSIPVHIMEMYVDAMEEYADEMAEWYKLRRERNRIRSHNAFILELANQDEAEREEAINEKGRELELAEQQRQAGVEDINRLETDIEKMRDDEGVEEGLSGKQIDPRLKRLKRGGIFIPLLRKFLSDEKPQVLSKKARERLEQPEEPFSPVRVAPASAPRESRSRSRRREAEADEKGDLEGDGMTHRGIGSMMGHYGICEEDSDSDMEDPVERVMKFQREPVMFDDRRNESFYTKPKK